MFIPCISEPHKLILPRFILANTQQLHDKIVQLNERVRQLEDALEGMQLSCSSDPHPLLRPELLQIKSTLELYGPQPTSRPTVDAPPEYQDESSVGPPTASPLLESVESEELYGPLARSEVGLLGTTSDHTYLIDYSILSK